MTKQELIQFLNKCIETLDEFIGICKSDVEINEVVDIDKATSNIKIIKRWMGKVQNDIDSDTIPVSFYESLKHDVEHNIPTKYYTSFRPNESKLASYRYISEQLSGISNLIEIYSFYKALGFAQRNTVLVGANGCGKTSLANLLQKSLNVSDGIVIPAQKLLIFPTFANTPNFASARTHFEKYQKYISNDKVSFDAKGMEDYDWTSTKSYASEMVKIMGMLLGERQVCINRASSRYKQGEQVPTRDFMGVLDDVIDIWNSLIEHRTLMCNDNNELKIKYNDTVYDAHQMSDGERVIIYIAGRVLFAPRNGIIIVDEPELHLHKSIANKLWDILENKRPDCRFIYFTHDLDFATSRNCQKAWIRNFNYPNKWSIELISESEIPEELLLKLLGSRKPILFCEGKQESLDRRVFEIIYPKFTIQPVGTCKNVINYTRAYNHVANTYCKAFGIIDKDFRTDTQLECLSKDYIFSYDIAEIENLFLSEDFVNEYASIKHEAINIQDIKNKVIAEFSNHIESQISFYISAYINFTFNESHIRQASTIAGVKANYHDFTSKINIEKLYTDRKNDLQQIINTNNYAKLITVANDKGLLKIVAQSFGLKGHDEFLSRALNILEFNPKAQTLLKLHLPSELH
uniref:AAA family ATPase n=1 Tax=Candidatus Limisoma sp. TaxID=3076476 RepID=UPI004024CE77